MRMTKDSLAGALTELRRILPLHDAGNPGEWAQRVAQALARLEQAVCREDATLETPAGQILDIDQGQIPSPGLDRQVDQLRDELADLFSEARDLRRCLQQAQGEGPANNLSPKVWEDFRGRVAALIKGLEHSEHEEERLVLETANTDIGGGD